MKKTIFLLIIASILLLTGCFNSTSPDPTDDNNITDEKGTLLLTIIKDNSSKNVTANTGTTQAVPAESTHVQLKIFNNNITITKRVALSDTTTTVSIPVPEGTYTIYCLAYKENVPTFGVNVEELLTMGQATGVIVAPDTDNAVSITLIRPKFTISMYRNSGADEITAGDSVVEGEELRIYLDTANDAEQTSMYEDIFDSYDINVVLNGSYNDHSNYSYDPTSFDLYHPETVPTVDNDTSTLSIVFELYTVEIQGWIFTQKIPTQTMTENSTVPPSDIPILQGVDVPITIN